MKLRFASWDVAAGAAAYLSKLFNDEILIKAVQVAVDTGLIHDEIGPASSIGAGSLGPRLTCFCESDFALLNGRDMNDKATSWRWFSFAAQGRGVYALRAYSRFARLRYKGGYTSHLEVIDAECKFFRAHLNHTQTQGNLFKSMMSLYGAMRGVWVTDAERMTATMCGAYGGKGTVP